MDGATDKGRTPGSGGAGGLLGLEELFLGIGGLGTVVCITEDRAKDGKRDRVGVESTKSNSARLDRRQVYESGRVSEALNADTDT